MKQCISSKRRIKQRLRAAIAVCAVLTISASAAKADESYGYALRGDSLSVTDGSGFAVFSVTVDSGRILGEENPFMRRRDIELSPFSSEAGLTMRYNKAVDAGGALSFSLSLHRDGGSLVGDSLAMVRYSTAFQREADPPLHLRPTNFEAIHVDEMKRLRAEKSKQIGVA